MNKSLLPCLLFIIILPGCGRNPDQAKRYSEMIIQCDSMIAGASHIIQYNRNKADSLNEMVNRAGKINTSGGRILNLEKELIRITELASEAEGVKKHVEAIKLFAAIGVKVNKRIIYFKRKYINYSTSIQIHDENVMIREITGGLSAEQFIKENMPAGK